MPLSEQDMIDSAEQARDYWIRAERYAMAYRLDHKNKKKLGERLKLLTIVLGAATGIAGLVPLVGNFIGEDLLQFWASIITGTIGVFTGIVTGCDVHYAPAKKAEAQWKCRIGLERIQTDLYHSVLDLKKGRIAAVGKIREADNQISGLVEESDVDADEEAGHKADREFERSLLAHQYFMICDPPVAFDGDDDGPDEEADDVSDDDDGPDEEADDMSAPPKKEV